MIKVGQIRLTESKPESSKETGFSLCLRYESMQTRQGLVQVSGTSDASKTKSGLIRSWSRSKLRPPSLDPALWTYGSYADMPLDAEPIIRFTSKMVTSSSLNFGSTSDLRFAIVPPALSARTFGTVDGLVDNPRGRSR